MAKKKTGGKPRKTFEENLDQLEKIVEFLESGELPLEDSIKKYEAGVEALKECYEILNEAQKKIETITSSKSGPGKSEPQAAEDREEADGDEEDSLF